MILILRIILCCYLLLPRVRATPRRCVTGYMTDLQSWVGEEGELSPYIEPSSAIDLSRKPNVMSSLQQQMAVVTPERHQVRYLSMARCKLNRVPPVFQLQDPKGNLLSDTVEYMTMYGNEFVDISTPGELYDITLNATNTMVIDPLTTMERDSSSFAIWSSALQTMRFPRLLQLDLRACSIKILTDNLFSNMPNLEALYLGENNIYLISSGAFNNLHKLKHLDLSRNSVFEDRMSKDLYFENEFVFDELVSMASLDMSFTSLVNTNVHAFRRLGKKMEKLSLCDTGLTRLFEGMFKNTSLKVLDISENTGSLMVPNMLSGLEDTLEILYANNVRLDNFELFNKFRKLEVLSLCGNEITLIPKYVVKSLKNLKVLDLDRNRMITWLLPIFSGSNKLKLLSLRDNNINAITEEMVNDFKDIPYIALSGNFAVCNCLARELIELAIQNEYRKRDLYFYETNERNLNFHTAFEDYNRFIANRQNVSRKCNEDKFCRYNRVDVNIDGDFLLADYGPHMYECLLDGENSVIPFFNVKPCNLTSREIDYEEKLGETWNKLLILIVIPTVIFPCLVFVYMFRRNFRYFFITMRNSAMISLIGKNEVIDDGTIFNYDVFVSYCNEDRAWVLDQLLPHLEGDCSIRACLHERDFQVGLSILENIVSCMDRSRAIMLIISQRFLLSQWCQFEMHLAQHRLLETRREDLTLLLLEEIPRRLRPNTLHYLMVTKTYIVWPKDQSEQAVFWRRLKKSLLTHRQSKIENTSLA